MTAVSDAPGQLFAPFWRCAKAPFLRASGGAWITYGELDRRAAGLAAWLAARGSPGDRVAILGAPSPTFVAAVFGAFRAGWIAVPINDRYRAGEIEHILRDSGARVLLHDPHAALADVSGARVPALALRLEMGARLATSIPPATPGALPITGRHAALLIYTSGTTGPSKGALLTYDAVVANMAALTGLWQWTREDILSLSLPLFHVHGLCIGIVGAALHGMAVLLHGRFDPAQVVEDFRTHDATLFMGVPTMYRRLLEYLEHDTSAAEPLRRGRLFTAGSAPLPAADLHAFEACTGHRILERYGMTETLITLSNPYEGERRPGSVGRPIPGCQVRVLDDHGHEVVGAPGELVVRSSGMMSGFWDQDTGTATSPAGGWFRTGDVGIVAPDGYVEIVGRKSWDVIKSGGFKISAREIEDALLTAEGVREVAIVGIPDATWGERIVGAVVVAPSLARADLEARLQDHVAGLLAEYKRPRALRVLEELPRNALGKVQKHRLRALFESNSG